MKQFISVVEPLIQEPKKDSERLGPEQTYTNIIFSPQIIHCFPSSATSQNFHDALPVPGA